MRFQSPTVGKEECDWVNSKWMESSWDDLGKALLEMWTLRQLLSVELQVFA